MKKVSKLFALLLLVALVVVPVAAQDEVTFTFGTNGDPVGMDPAVVTDGVSFRIITQGCESLTAYDGSLTSVVPSLASSWEASEDGMTWVFQLQEGVQFHDGTDFNADAVVWNFSRWQFTDNPVHFEEQSYEYYEYMFGGFNDESFVASVEATGDYEVTFVLNNPNGSFLNTLGMPMFSLASPAAVEAAGSAYGTPDIGYVCTGPYTFGEWINGERAVLNTNENYWGDVSGNVERIVFQQIPDNAARFAALSAGEIDAFEGPNVEDLPGIEASEDLYINYRGPLNVLYLAFNYRIAELRDPLVRQAISMAFDREAIAEAFYPPGAIPASTMLPPSLWGFNADIPVTAYDPDGAIALLAEAGYPDGISEFTVLGLNDDGTVSDEVVDTIPIDLYYQPVARPYNPDGEGIGEAQVSYLADIGVEANLASAGDWSTYLDQRREGNLLGLYQLGWTGDNGDPDNFLGFFFAATDQSQPREGYMETPELAAILQEARALADKDDREPLYQQAEQMIYDNTYRIFMAHSQVPIALRSCVDGYVTNPLGTELYRTITVGC